MPIRNEREQFEFDYRKATKADQHHFDRNNNGEYATLITKGAYAGYQVGRRALLRSIPVDALTTAVEALSERVDSAESDHVAFKRMYPRSKVTIGQSELSVQKMKDELVAMQCLLSEVKHARNRRKK